MEKAKKLKNDLNQLQMTISQAADLLNRPNSNMVYHATGFINLALKQINKITKRLNDDIS